jgi:pilus assembly protein TadC
MDVPFIEEFGKAFLPKRFQPTIKSYLSKAGVYKSPYVFIGILFYISLAFTLFGMFLFVYPLIISFATTWGIDGLIRALAIGGLVFISWSVIQIALMAIFFLIGYFILDIQIYKRVQDLELMLPEYLSVVSTNLKGGMSLESAMWNAIRPEFGVLSHEVTMVSKKVMTGHDLTEALAELSTKYDSPELKRTLSLIVSEFEIGGKISDIIDDITRHLKDTQKIKRKMQASVLSYIIFISAIVIFIAPILYALSYNLIAFMQTFIAKVGGSLSTSNVPSFLSNISPDAIDAELFKKFGYVAVATVSFMSSLIVAIIEKGDIRGSLKYVPLYVCVALLVYHVALSVLSVFLGGIVI